MKDFISIIGILAVFAVFVFVMGFGFGVVADYWNGTARAALIEKQTGVKYTWREAAQIKTMYDQQNVKIVFEHEKEK